MDKLFLDAAKKLKALGDTFEAIAATCSDKKPANTAKAPAEKKVSLEDVRAVLVQKSQAGLTAEVKELITRFGGSRLSDVSADQYAALLKEAEALGNG